MIPVNRPLITKSDIDAVSKALSDTEVSGTSRSVKELEDKICEKLNVRNAIAVSSGTSAIDCLVDAIGVEENQNILVPNLTIISAVSHMIRKKIAVHSVDVDINTYMPTKEEYLKHINHRTAAIFPTHIYGLVSETRQLEMAAKELNPNVEVYEDAAESFGVRLADGSFSGTNSRAGVFSFYANKNVTGGEGGAIVTNDDDLANNLRELRNLGFSLTGQRFINNRIGWNARIHGLSAALISSQIDRIEKIIEAKREIGRTYLEKLHNHPWLTFQAAANDTVMNAYWVFAIQLNENCPYSVEELTELLRKRDIETRRFFYPIDLQPVMKDTTLLSRGDDMKNSHSLWERGLYLPSGLGNTSSEIEYVCSTLWKILSE